MKNNPRIKYVLMAAAVFIWGLIIYKVIAGLSAPDFPTDPQPNVKMPQKNISDSFGLIAENYPDPFLSPVEDTATSDTGGGAVVSPPAQPVGTPAEQPDAGTVSTEPAITIKYIGYINNPATHKSTAIVSVNGQTQIIGVNDFIMSDVKVSKISPDEVILLEHGTREHIGYNK